MTERPVLNVVQLSDSFHSIWADFGAELDLEAQIFDLEASLPVQGIAIVVAAGGLEDQGLDALLTLMDRYRPPVYLVGANPSHRFGVEAVRRGAADYFALPDDLDLLRRTLSARVEAAREQQGPTEVAATAFDAIRGKSDALRATLDKAARVVPHSDVTILISGETGTGKELMARALHDGGPRAQEPFVAVNCAAIPATLLESELFGHEKGAFTDAHRSKIGLFQEADKGTLFLDEIGHLPLELQGKILRALEEKRVRKVGSNDSLPVNVRFIAATHVNLRDAVAAGDFREDLYYRLNVITLELPPLRERGDDIELLAREFVQSLSSRYDLPTPQIDGDFLATLRAHHWPGNVRELYHALERALLLSAPGTLSSAELLPTERGQSRHTEGVIPFPATLREVNQAAVLAALRLHNGNKSAAARELGVSRARLQRLMDPGKAGESGSDDE